ncbi:lmo0937 family membrane protein [Nibribacter ruber]|uniref:Lmo0937 family membrane protein n=2 Tax=Cytophagales TaxID=768507 RepID=A0A6P1P4Q2_9BACT|nr:lmo0937 family membrane protein [Nibribacter ruber]
MNLLEYCCVQAKNSIRKHAKCSRRKETKLKPNTTKTMGNLLYIIAVVLVIIWLIGFLGFGDQVGGIIHILLVIAVIAVVLRLIRRA